MSNAKNSTETLKNLNQKPLRRPSLENKMQASAGRRGNITSSRNLLAGEK